MIQYEDFSLKIEPSRGDFFPVIVLRSPAGEGRSEFRLPFQPDEIGDILFDLGETVRGSSGKVVREAAPGATRTRPQQIGDQLFNSLFTGPVRSLLDRSLGMLHGSKQGLRVKLHIDPEEASLAQLTSLPWELMYRKETREFLNLSSFTPILRYLDVQVPCIPLPLEPPLRILVVIASPLDHAQLDLERERRQIEETWARQQDVAVDFLQPATILELQERLAAGPYHALHYMGHGGFDQRTGRGVLFLEDQHGYGAAVEGSTLGVLLRDVPTLRLVFLNACETARVTKQVGLDPFAGVAAALVMAGVPAVVAMQFPITDGAAIRFANRFYPLLADGQPVDYAVAQGRKSVLAAESGTMEWATPVLFMRAPEGTIFKVSGVHKAQRRLHDPPTLDDEELAQQLEERYIAGLGAFWLEEWDKAVRRFEAVAAVRPDYQDVAAKLEEARRRQRWDGLYEQAQEARTAEDWGTVMAVLDELVAENAEFKDAAALLELARRQKQLGDLYAQAQRLHSAANWRAVVNVFAQIHTLDPDYPDPDGLLPSAEKKVAEQERQAALSDLFGRAVREMDAGRWAQASLLLTQVQEAEAGYRGADRLLERAEAESARQEAERQHKGKLAALYDQAVNRAEAGQWAQAAAKMDEIHAMDPDFADPLNVAARARAEVERERYLEALYSQAQAAQEAGDWPEAQTALQALLDEDAGYLDAAALLAEAEKQQELAALYAQVQRQHRAGEWRAVVGTFASIAALDPGYADPEGLLAAAERSLAAQERQAELDKLYGRAEQALETGDWAQARRLLVRIREMEPGFRESEQLLARAETEIQQAEAERQRQELIATLYEQAQSLARARQWRPALAKMDEIRALDPEFADPEGIVAIAREKVSQEEAEAQRQNELAALYAEAVRLLKAEQYQEALQKWGEVQALDPRYPDHKKVQSTARKKLDRLARPRTERRLPHWAWLAIGGIAVVAVIVVAILLGGGGGGGTPKVTSAPAPAQADLSADPWGEVVIPPGAPVKLAFVGPLSGDDAGWGEVMLMAFEMAINEAGSVQGFHFELASRDGGCDEYLAQQAAGELISDESIVGVIGHGCSNSCASAGPLYEEGHLVTISPSCSGTDLTEQGWEIFNRIAPRDDRVGWETYLRQVASTSTYQQFATGFQEHFGQPIPEVPWEDGSDLAVYGGHSYDAASILISAIKQVAQTDESGNLVIGRQALAGAVRATSGWQGATGVVSFDENGDRVVASGDVAPVPAATPLPGTETVPLDELASSIPWLPYDTSAVPSTLFYAFNLSKPPFDDVRVRQAFALAVDRSAVADLVGASGLPRPLPATSFTPPDVLGRDLYGQVGLAFDPDRARELLAQAGYPNGEGFPGTTLVFNCSERYLLNESKSQAIAQAVATMWADNLAVSVDTDCIEGWDAYTAQLDSDAPAIYRLGWVADVIDPDNFLSYFATGFGASESHFSDAAYSAAISTAGNNPGNPTLRQALYIQAERILCEEQAVVIPLYHFYSQQ